MRKMLFMMAVLLIPISVLAQTNQDACNAAGSGPDVTWSGRPFTILWVMDATVPISPTDPTQVPQRINGFTIQIDGQNRTDITPVAGSPCPTGTAQAGKIPYLYRSEFGVARGAHTLSLLAWNFVLDANGNPTVTRQESAVVTRPFVANDPLPVGPPIAPSNVKIVR